VECSVTVLEKFAEQLSAGRAAPVPNHVKSLLSLHLADAVGAWICGARTVEGRMLLQSKTFSRDDIADQVGVHAALTRLSEIDSIHLPSGITPGGIIFPAAVVLAAARPGVTSDVFESAILSGIEAMVRLGEAIDGATVLYRGIWPTYFGASFGVAAVAAKIEGLDARQTAHALALALTMASPGVGHHNAVTSSRWFALGQMAARGVRAVRAAAEGFTSDVGLLEGGFLDGAYGVTPNLRSLSAADDAMLAIEDVSLKPWCAARQTMAATQALVEILDGGVDAGAIQSVEVGVLPAQRKMVDHGVRGGDRASHLTSVQFNLALAATQRSGLYDIAHSPEVLPDKVEAFMRKVSVAPDEGLIQHFPASWPARVVVRTARGKHERTALAVPGDPTRRFDPDGIFDKLARCGMFTEKGDQSRQLIVDCIEREARPGPASALRERIVASF
jgi:2-methylcitrate dehydratase PrpD